MLRETKQICQCSPTQTSRSLEVIALYVQISCALLPPRASTKRTPCSAFMSQVCFSKYRSIALWKTRPRDCCILISKAELTCVCVVAAWVAGCTAHIGRQAKGVSPAAGHYLLIPLFASSCQLARSLNIKTQADKTRRTSDVWTLRYILHYNLSATFCLHPQCPISQLCGSPCRSARQGGTQKQLALTWQLNLMLASLPHGQQFLLQ